MKLFADDTEGVIPDLAVVCDMNKLKDPLWIMDAPDALIFPGAFLFIKVPEDIFAEEGVPSGKWPPMF